MRKTFDCVAMKRRGAEKIHRQTAGMSAEQVLAFWRQRTEELRQKKRRARGKKRASQQVKEARTASAGLFFQSK